MTQIQVFDPPMCCSTGVCGPSVDPALARFAADLEWLQANEVAAERFNLALQPGAFAESAVVRTALEEAGNDCLPLIVVDGRIVSRAVYPDRDTLARLAGLTDAGGPSLLLRTPVEAAAPSSAGDCCAPSPTGPVGGCCC